jgi:23S rRNA pseudouridine2605 synthase
MSDEPQRIAKYLARAGIASRREIERMIAIGQISLNGKLLDTPAVKVTSADVILVNGTPVGEADKVRFWRYYKPIGLVTTDRDEKGRETIYDHFPPNMPRVMTVGRLDINSEGLLLLTNDGGLKRQLELPSTGWLRRYRVRVNGNPTEAMVEPLRQGIVVDRERFKGMEVRLDRQQGSNAWLTIGLREGKNREIRRAMEYVGLRVNRLIRTSYGPFKLDDLNPGDVEEMKAKTIKDQLGL